MKLGSQAVIHGGEIGVQFQPGWLPAKLSRMIVLNSLISLLEKLLRKPKCARSLFLAIETSGTCSPVRFLRRILRIGTLFRQPCSIWSRLRLFQMRSDRGWATLRTIYGYIGRRLALCTVDHVGGDALLGS